MRFLLNSYLCYFHLALKSKDYVGVSAGSQLPSGGSGCKPADTGRKVVGSIRILWFVHFFRVFHHRWRCKDKPQAGIKLASDKVAPIWRDLNSGRSSYQQLQRQIFNKFNISRERCLIFTEVKNWRWAKNIVIQSKLRVLWDLHSVCTDLKGTHVMGECCTFTPQIA